MGCVSPGTEMNDSAPRRQPSSDRNPIDDRISTGDISSGETRQVLSVSLPAERHLERGVGEKNEGLWD